MNGVNHSGLIRRVQVLERLGVGRGNVKARYAQDGSIKIIESLVLNRVYDLRPDAAKRPAFLHDDAPVRLPDGLKNGFGVERTKRSRVDDLGLDSFLFKFLGRLERHMDHLGVRNQRNVVSGTLDFRNTQRNRVLALRNFALQTIEDFRFDKNDRVVITNRGLQQALGICGRGRGHYLEARDVAEPGFQRLGMLGGKLMAGAARPAYHHWRANLPSRHIKHLGGTVDNLVKGQQREIESHHFNDGPQSRHGGAHTEACEAKLRDGRVEDPL